MKFEELNLDAESISLLQRNGINNLNGFIGTQLKETYNEEVNCFVLSVNEIDTIESPNWAQISLRWPEKHESRLYCKVHLLQIPQRDKNGGFTAQMRDPQKRGGKSDDYVNIQSGRTPLDDLSEAMELSKEEFTRLEDWAKEGIESEGYTRPIILRPKTNDAYLAFSIRIAIDPIKGSLSKNPVGMEQVELNKITLAAASTSRTLTKFNLKPVPVKDNSIPF